MESGEDGGKIWPQIVTICVACLASFTSGVLFSWTSPFIVKIVNDTVNYNITETEAALFPTIHPISTIVFSFFVPALNDIIGRKYSVILVAIPQIFSWLLKAFARNVWVFYLSRVVYGISDAMHFGSVPVYLAEISVPSVRGKWANLVAFVNVGQFMINLIGQRFSVWSTSLICLAFPVIFIIAMLFMPESPYYYIIKNKEEEARKVLQFLRGKGDVDEELLQIRADTKRQVSEQGTWKDLFSIPSNRKAVFASVFLRLSQEFSGISVVMSYIQFIFDKSGSNLTPEASSLIITAMFAILTFVAGPVNERFGRKKSYISSLLACAIVLLAQSAYFYLDQNTSVNLENWTWFPLTGMVLYTIFLSFGVAAIPTIMMGELFSNSIKAKGVGFNAVMLNLFMFASSAVFCALFMYGLYAPFLCFGIFSVVCSILSIYFVPETKGKTLEEIQQAFKNSAADNKNFFLINSKNRR